MSIWNRYVGIYDRLWVQKVSLAPTRRKVIHTLLGLFDGKEDFSLLDISCGTGQLLSEVAEAMPNSKRLGVEPSDLGTLAARKGHSVLPYTIDALHKVPEQFDVITCTHAFPYYPDQVKALRLMSDRLRPGGILLLAHAETATLYDKLCLSLVKLTTSKAHYPTPATLKGWLAQTDVALTLLDRQRINGKGVPSITLYTARKQP